MRHIISVFALVGAFMAAAPAHAGTCKPLDPYLKHCEGTCPLQSCGDWACRELDGGLHMCLDLSDGSEWTTDCPECEDEPPPGCRTSVVVADKEGREARACIDGGARDLLAVVEASNLDESVITCVTDIESGEVCFDSVTAAPGEGPSSVTCKDHWDTGSACEITCDGHTLFCVNHWISYACWSFKEGESIHPTSATSGLGHICG